MNSSMILNGIVSDWLCVNLIVVQALRLYEKYKQLVAAGEFHDKVALCVPMTPLNLLFCCCIGDV